MKVPLAKLYPTGTTPPQPQIVYGGLSLPATWWTEEDEAFLRWCNAGGDLTLQEYESLPVAEPVPPPQPVNKFWPAQALGGIVPGLGPTIAGAIAGLVMGVAVHHINNSRRR